MGMAFKRKHLGWLGLVAVVLGCLVVLGVI
jgi:hypothetical protein